MAKREKDILNSHHYSTACLQTDKMGKTLQSNNLDKTLQSNNLLISYAYETIQS